MKLNRALEVVDALSGARQILVTGPQRAGTHIVTAMLAAKFGLRYIEEAEVNSDGWNSMRRALGVKNVAIQCPAFAHKIHHVAAAPHRAIVWVNRERSAVMRSQDRIGWSKNIEQLEITVYENTWGPALKGERAYDIKNRIWSTRQKMRVNMPVYEIDFESEFVQQHEMFVKKKDRTGFRHNQIAL